MGSHSPVTGGATCAVGCVQVGFAQRGKWASSNSACADVNKTLLGDLMNRNFDLFPGATPMYTISSDLGAILLACTSSGRCTYAVHPKMCRCATVAQTTVPMFACFALNSILCDRTLTPSKSMSI